MYGQNSAGDVMRSSRWLLCTSILFMAGPQAWAQINNGFDARQIFAIKQTPNPEVSGSPFMGTIKVYQESDGAFVRDFTGHEGWISLTFSGEGTNDARCYALRKRNTTGVGGPIDPPVNDLPDDLFMSSLPGWVPTNNVLDGSIRYSTFHDTLFIGFDRNPSATDPGIVHEINLGLSQILNTPTRAPTPIRAAESMWKSIPAMASCT
jgi:hypothetical protein